MASPSTGKPYGIERVCAAWGQSRSSYYAARSLKQDSDAQPGKRRPKTALLDEEVLALIRADLAASPFQGEGYRKVWARLRFVKGPEISGKRVLRLMRGSNLLSPFRVR
ncbi:hypothetical protein D3C87_1394820 [compost metagenome]